MQTAGDADSHLEEACSDLQAFQEETDLSLMRICQAIFDGNKHAIKVQNKDVAVNNLCSIIEATLALANRWGFAAMSMRDLARESGMSLGGLYAYFGSKDELVQVILYQGSEVFSHVIRQRIAAFEGQPRKQLEEAVHSHIMASEVMRPWFVFLYMEARHLRDAERLDAIAMDQSSEKIFADIITLGCEHGVFCSIEPTLDAGMIKALVQDWYLKRRRHVARGVTASVYVDMIQNVMDKYLAIEVSA